MRAVLWALFVGVIDFLLPLGITLRADFVPRGANAPAICTVGMTLRSATGGTM